MKYGIDLIRSLNTELENNNEIANIRQKNLDENKFDIDDCFVSVAANSLTDSLLKAKLNILANNGCSKFEKLCDLSGNIIDAWIINGKYGLCWMLSDDDANVHGTKFVSFAKRAATYAKKGFMVKYVNLPAWASLTAPKGAKGFSGMSQVQVNVFESHTNYFTGESVTF